MQLNVDKNPLVAVALLFSYCEVNEWYAGDIYSSENLIDKFCLFKRSVKLMLIYQLLMTMHEPVMGIIQQNPCDGSSNIKNNTTSALDELVKMSAVFQVDNKFLC